MVPKNLGAYSSFVCKEFHFCPWFVIVVNVAKLGNTIVMIIETLRRCCENFVSVSFDRRLKLDSIPETERNGQLDDTLPLSEEESDTPADDTKPANNENSQISNTNKEESDTNTEKSNDSIQSMTDTSPSPSTTPETTTAEKINDEKSPSLSTDGEDVLEPLSLEKSDEPEQPNEESVQEQKDEKIAEEKVERTDHNITSESEGKQFIFSFHHPDGVL